MAIRLEAQLDGSLFDGDPSDFARYVRLIPGDPKPPVHSR
jgi:hypothetical protein